MRRASRPGGTISAAVRLFAAAVLICCATGAHGQTVDSVRGEQIAVQKCGHCHATGKTGVSPHAITPPFRDLHQRFPIDMIVDAVRTGAIEGHDEMPMFDFTADDVRALIGYIDSLSPAGSRYLQAPAR